MAACTAPYCARPRDPEPEIAKPAEAAGLHIRRTGESSCLWQDELPLNRRRFASPSFAPQAKYALGQPLPGGCCCTPEATFVPNCRCSLRRIRRPRRARGPRWLLVRLARYADREGRCFPSMRTLAAGARKSLATVCRWLKQLFDRGCFTRTRETGRVYHYTLAEPYRLRWRERPKSLAGRVFHRARGCFTACKTESRTN